MNRDPRSRDPRSRDPRQRNSTAAAVPKAQPTAASPALNTTEETPAEDSAKAVEPQGSQSDQARETEKEPKKGVPPQVKEVLTKLMTDQMMDLLVDLIHGEHMRTRSATGPGASSAGLLRKRKDAVPSVASMKRAGTGMQSLRKKVDSGQQFMMAGTKKRDRATIEDIEAEMREKRDKDPILSIFGHG